MGNKRELFTRKNLITVGEIFGILVVGYLIYYDNQSLQERFILWKGLSTNPTNTKDRIPLRDTPPLPTQTPMPSLTPKLEPPNPPEWDCGMVNNPLVEGYDPSQPDAPTASHVLSLPDIGEPGVDGPPYLLIHLDGTSKQVNTLQGLNLVLNRQRICAKVPSAPAVRLSQNRIVSLQKKHEPNLPYKGILYRSKS